MKEENKKYIINEILPSNKEALYDYAREQIQMVFAKLCVIKELDLKNDIEMVELEAMLLSSAIQTELIDNCVSICLHNINEEKEKIKNEWS